MEEMSTVVPAKQGLSNGTGEHALEPSPKINGVHGINGNATRPRTVSTPSSLSFQERSRPLAIPSPGPIRASFSSSGSFGESNSPPSPFRTTFGHSRTRSTSRPIHSPLATSFQPGSPDSSSFQFPTSSNGDLPGNGPTSPVLQNSRRHSRIHSRNLSIFFPQNKAPNGTLLSPAKFSQSPTSLTDASDGGHNASKQSKGTGRRATDKPAKQLSSQPKA